jgi:hypothetical protein
MTRTRRPRADWWSGAVRKGTARSTRRLRARDVGKARGGLGKVRVGRGHQGGGVALARRRRESTARHCVPAVLVAVCPGFDCVYLKISQLKCTK